MPVGREAVVEGRPAEGVEPGDKAAAGVVEPGDRASPGDRVAAGDKAVAGEAVPGDKDKEEEPQAELGSPEGREENGSECKS